MKGREIPMPGREKDETERGGSGAGIMGETRGILTEPSYQTLQCL